MATGLGIDIGAEHIKVVQAKVSGGVVTVTGALKFPRKPSSGPDMPDLPPDQQDESGGLTIPESLGAELKRAGLSRSGTLGISGREVILKYLAAPPMPPDKLKMFIDMEIGGRLTSKGGDGDGPSVTYDYRILNVPSGLRGDLIMMAGVCKNEYLYGINAALKAAGVSANHITPSCFGMVNAYLRTQQIKENETVVLVDVGHELLEIAILEEKNLYFARSAPGGGKKFTAALDKVLKIGIDKACEFKKERAKIYPEGAQIPSKQELMFQSALKEGADGIVSAVRSSVMFCRTQAKLPKLDYAKIILSGGGARLSGLREYVEKKAGRPVEVLDLYKNLDLRKLDAASARCFEGDVPDMTVALGLAIIDADPSCFHFALVPEKVRRRQTFLRKTVYGIAAGVVMMAAVIPPIQSSQKAAADQNALVQNYDELRQEAKKKKAEFETRRQENKRLQLKTDYYARQTRMGRVYLQLLTKIRAETPPDVLLTALGPNTDGVAGATAGGGVGLGSWNFIDEPVTRLVLRGHYTLAAYPDVKFNEAWEGMRKKLLEIPGVKGAQLEPVNDEDKDKMKPDTKIFEAKIFLHDDTKPLAAAVAKTPAAKPDGKTAAPAATPSGTGTKAN